MNKNERMSMIERKLNQDRYIIKFENSKVSDKFFSSEYIKKNLDVIYLSGNKLKAEIYFDKRQTIDEISNKIIEILDIKKNEFDIIHKGQGLSTLFPL
ncbi:MAG: hypothetical protein ACTH54_00750 [Vagococcus salmoninarum]|uniref:hypothetical protein n=1 Tax=Vagococcus salmoninarum TaxID=2739 RepID=UPI003F98214E